MSYILDALKKQQSEEKQPSTSSSSQSAISAQQSPSMLLWGILLTIAIFIALSAGFWMGKQSNNTPTQASVDASKNSSAMLTENDFKPTTPIKVTEHKPKSAEHYFQTPPAKTVKATNKPIVDAKIDTKTKPLILGANTDRVSEDGNIIEKSTQEPLNKLNDKVSASLLAKFEAAVSDTPLDDNSSGTVAEGIQDVSQLPVHVQQAIKPFSFAMHIYQSNDQGWVKVDEQEYYQGEQLPNGVVIEKIEPQFVVMNFDGYQFSMAALSSWE